MGITIMDQCRIVKHLQVSKCICVLALITISCVNNLCADEPIVDGKEVFVRDWSKHKVQDAAKTGADGLGPLYNAVSCVACHGQGGIGGAGNNDHNVQLLTLTTTTVLQRQATLKVNISDLKNSPIHPGLKSTSSVVLHRFSVNPRYALMHREWRLLSKVEPIGMVKGLEPLGITARIAHRMSSLAKPGFKPVLAYVRSERNTPSLFGLGQIDSIPEKSLKHLAIRQNSRYAELSGKVAPNGGKFGWRGQTSSVKNFVLGACANELGLQTANFRQPQDPADPFPRPTDTVDMTSSEVNALVKFVNELPPPVELGADSAVKRLELAQGQAHFTAVRCDSCHVRQIDNVVGIYSDLLLHNMGERLNDPAALAPRGGTGSLAQYYGTGESLLVSDELKQEWRTPPLWGVRDSAPYLHDGSAETIEEAILAHAGEATASIRSFEKLTWGEKRALMRFVESLGAPNPDRVVASAE